MIQKCCLCERVYSQKPPYDDESVTHGYCEVCAEVERARVAFYLETDL